MAEIDLTPTEEMAANAARGLELRRKHGKGGTEIGVARARDISNRKNLSPETVRRMHAFFSRHEKNKAGGEDDAGYIAWLLWGGDSGQSWAKRKVEQMNKDENQRSDTYKEIAQRLGSAAKFASIDAGMMDGAGNEVVIRMADGSRATARYNRGTGKWSLEGHADVPAFAKVRDLVAHLTKQGMARPGDRAQFSNGARNRAFLSKIDAATRSKILTSIAKHYGISASEAMAEVTDADAESLLDYMTEPERSATSVLLKRHGFSRPGAKAKMAKNLRELNTYLSSLIRQRDMLVSDDRRAKGKDLRVANHLNRIRQEIDAVLMDIARAEKATASRPGAKAVMGKATDALDYIKSSIASGKTVYVQAGSRTTKITPQTYAKWEAAGRTLFKISNDGALLMASGSSYVRLTMGEEMLVRVTAMSRPGAKAKMAVEAGWRVSPDAKSSGLTVTELLPKLAKGHTFYANLKSGGTVSGTLKAFSTSGVKIDKYGDVTDLRWSDIASIGAGNIGTGPYPIRASRPGAKVANAIREGEKVSASDDAVSRKIRKLMDEGKPQKQAVAIALDLERRGEL